MDDLISRQAAIDAIHRALFDIFDLIEEDDESPMAEKDLFVLKINKVVCNSIKALPTVQRVESVGMRWIPCSVRLPDNTGESVYVTVLDESGDYPYRYATQGWMIPGHSNEWVVDDEYRCDVVAWMPNPRPWKGEE